MNDETEAEPRSPRRRDRGAMEARLVEAARAEFARLGYAAATTRGIAAKVGCSEALIQNYFGGKEGLLMEVLRNTDPVSNTFLEFFQRPPCPTPEAEIRETVHWIMAGMHRRAAGFRIVFERVLLDPTFAQRFAELTPRHTLIAALGKRFATVWPKQTDPEGAAELIVALAFQYGFVDPELLGRDHDTIERSIERHITLLVTGLTG